LLRFSAGAAGALLAGLLAFGPSVFEIGSIAFQCISVGLLAAGTLALVRERRLGRAVALACVFAALRFGFPHRPDVVASVLAGLSGLLLGLGLLAVSLVYDSLTDVGFRFGKFLVVGPLVGGVFLAASPLTQLYSQSSADPVMHAVFQLFLGVVIGDGVAFGCELVEMLASRRTLPLRPASAGVGLKQGGAEVLEPGVAHDADDRRAGP